MGEKQLKLGSDELRIVWSEVYAPHKPDSDRDFMNPEQIREMAYKFMKSARLNSIDVQHNNQLVPGANVVESFIARKGDPDFLEGSWVVGVHVPDDDTWAKIKKGELNGFSMEAMVVRDPTEIEIEIPPVVSGRTAKAEDGHEHTFFVAYDEDGSFKGGRTDVVNGHSHVIKRGTITEKSAEHHHRFSYIDILRIAEEQQ